MIKSKKHLYQNQRVHLSHHLPRASGDKVTGLLTLLLVSYLELAVRCFVCGERFVWVLAVTFISLSSCPWYRQHWEQRKVIRRISLWIQFVSYAGTCSILRVICQLDRWHIGVIWQWTWHGSCDMTWYDIMTTHQGGHQGSKHWYWWAEIGSPGTILTLLLLLRILTLLRRRRISVFVSGHTEHTSLLWPNVGLLSPLSWIRHKNQIMWLSRGT